MPLVDRRTNSVVLRIVYDGPPEAGKTTNLRHLCERLSLSRRGPLESPGGGDRTQFFDWLDVTGGWVGGHRVRCQLVTVPGQIQLARRRRHILDSADVVVLVADSRPRAAPETNAALRSLVRGLGNRADVPLVLQANKQDLPDAQPPEALHALLGLAARVPVVAAHAAGGGGVVETFMLAVRLAVDHVRALLVAGELGEGEATGAADLLRALEADAPEAFDALDAIARAADAPTAPATDIAGAVPTTAIRNTTTRPIRSTRRSRVNLTAAAAAAVEAVNQALSSGATEVNAEASGPVPAASAAPAVAGAEAGAQPAEHATAQPIRIVRCAPVRAATMSRIDSPIAARTTTLLGTGRGTGGSSGRDSGDPAADATGRATSEEPTRPIRIIRGAPLRLTRTGTGATSAGPPHTSVVALHGAPDPAGDAASAAPPHVPASVLAMHPSAPAVAGPSHDAAPRGRLSDPGPFMALGTAPYAISQAARSQPPRDPEPSATGTASFPVATAAPGANADPAPVPFTVPAAVLSRPPSAPEPSGALGAALFTISGPRAASALSPQAVGPAIAHSAAPVRVATSGDDTAAPAPDRAPFVAPASGGGLVAIGEPIVELAAELVSPDPVDPPRRRSPAIAIVAAALTAPTRFETVTAEVTVPEGESADAVTVEIVAVEAITVERPAVELASTRRIARMSEAEISRFLATGPIEPFVGTDDDSTLDLPAVDPPPTARVPHREPATRAATEATAAGATAGAVTGTAATAAADLAWMSASTETGHTPVQSAEATIVSAATDATTAAAATEATDIASMLVATGAAGITSIADAPAPSTLADAAEAYAATRGAHVEPALVSAASEATAAADIAPMSASTAHAPAPGTLADAAEAYAATRGAHVEPALVSAASEASAAPAAAEAGAVHDATTSGEPRAALAGAVAAQAGAEAAQADVIASLPFPLPSVDVPAGLVWPAVSGRAALTALAGPLRLVEKAAPWAPAAAIEIECGDGWIAHSSAEMLFADLDQARPALFEVARWQAKLGPLTPPGRTYALSPERGGVRMWVLTPSHRTVWVAIEEAFARGDRLTAARLARTGLEAVDEIRARGAAITDLDHVAADEPARLLATPWTPNRDRLIAQLQRLFAAAVL